MRFWPRKRRWTVRTENGRTLKYDERGVPWLKYGASPGIEITTGPPDVTPQPQGTDGATADA